MLLHLFFIALSSALSVAFLSVSSNFIPAALIDVHKDTLDLSHLRGKEQVGFWFQLSVLLRRHLRSMSRDMVGFDLRYGFRKYLIYNSFILGRCPNACGDARGGGPAFGRGLLADRKRCRKNSIQCLLPVLHHPVCLRWQCDALDPAVHAGFGCVHQGVLQWLVLPGSLLSVQGPSRSAPATDLPHIIHQHRVLYDSAGSS